MASPRADSSATPICRCRVLYLGSSVPHITKDGLQGIQEPLRELYPEQGASGARGIDSWLSVWSNGLLLENVDENHKKVTRFFPIDSLHYCAAVRYVMVPNSSPNMAAPPRFLPLDSPFARHPNLQHPPLFAAILRRTTGIKVLECHAFICKREMAANALVKCCFHAYADASYAKQIDNGGGSGGGGGGGGGNGSRYGTLQPPSKAGSVLGEAASSIEKVEGWRTNGSNGGGGTLMRNEENTPGIDDISIYNGDENHKVWAGAEPNGDFSASTLRSTRSTRPRQMMQPTKTPPPPPPPPMPFFKAAEPLEIIKKPQNQLAVKDKGPSRPSITLEDILGVQLKKTPAVRPYSDRTPSKGSGLKGPLVSVDMIRSVKLKPTTMRRQSLERPLQTPSSIFFHSRNPSIFTETESELKI